MIVIINGPCGVGKTEVSWNLVERFPEGVMLDGDHIGAVHPFEIYDQQRIAYLYQTIRHLVAFHIEHGYTNFVVNYVFETPESLAELRGSGACCPSWMP
jgi:tRNA A37 N6-isopentenylltransferase MiaA